MKILQLQSENFKRISVVNITPDGNLVEITGKNGQGKSSVLESIWVALGGAKHIQSVPIRKGAKEARIRLNLGDINVTRTFREGADGGYTTKIVVETAEGFRATKPQEILDDLFGSLTFDPLAFTRMKPKDQFDELRQFVPDIDFEGVERDNKKDFERRTDLNRQAKQSRAAADLIVVPLNLPVHELDISDMLDRFERAGKANSEIELRTERRRNTQQRVDQLRLDATQIVATVGDRQAEISKKAAEKCADFDRRVQALQEQIRVLLEQSVAVTQKCDEDVAAVATRATEAATAKTREADELTLKLEEAGPLPEPVDLAALRAEIEEARSTNALIARRDTRTAHLVQADDAEAAAKDLTATMEARTAAKGDAGNRQRGRGEGPHGHDGGQNGSQRSGDRRSRAAGSRHHLWRRRHPAERTAIQPGEQRGAAADLGGDRHGQRPGAAGDAGSGRLPARRGWHAAPGRDGRGTRLPSLG
jgi:hypothetical protein